MNSPKPLRHPSQHSFFYVCLHPCTLYAVYVQPTRGFLKRFKINKKTKNSKLSKLTYDHSWNCDAGNKGNHDRRANERSQLPQQLFLPRPRFCTPESATGRAEIVKIRDFFLAQPAEFRTAHSTHHVVARPVVNLHYQHLASRTRFDVVALKEKRVKNKFNSKWNYKLTML